MMSVWQNFKTWLLIGLLYSAYCAVKGTKFVKCTALPRLSGRKN